MYTKIGRILSKKEVSKIVDLIKQTRMLNEQACSLTLDMANPATSSTITVRWQRAKPGQGDWESLSVVYSCEPRNDMDDELFDNVETFAEAYGLKVM
jgi:hypothetical protein